MTYLTQTHTTEGLMILTVYVHTIWMFWSSQKRRSRFKQLVVKITMNTNQSMFPAFLRLEERVIFPCHNLGADFVHTHRHSYFFITRDFRSLLDLVELFGLFVLFQRVVLVLVFVCIISILCIVLIVWFVWICWIAWIVLIDCLYCFLDWVELV